MDNRKPDQEEPPQFGMGKFLFSIVLAFLLLLLLQSMVRHRFFRGGRVKEYGPPIACDYSGSVVHWPPVESD
jgi:hypothetical protein